jgi:hypothetical protein
MAWVALPGAYVPASIALLVVGARKPPLHYTAVLLEEDIKNTQLNYNYSFINSNIYIFRYETGR